MARLSKKNEELLRAVQRQSARERKKPTGSQPQGKETIQSVEAEGEVSGDEAIESTSPPVSSAVGLGVDLIEIERMERAIERTPRILERVFTSGEREYAWNRPRPAVHYAAFFAAREAVLKALGCGFTGIAYQDVEVSHDDRGKPIVLLHGNAQHVAKLQGVVEMQISLSHTHQMAVASAVAIKKESSPKRRETVDPMEELARQFKQLRSMLDDLGVSAIIDEEEPDVQLSDEQQDHEVIADKQEHE